MEPHANLTVGPVVQSPFPLDTTVRCQSRKVLARQVETLSLRTVINASAEDARKASRISPPIANAGTRGAHYPWPVRWNTPAVKRR